MPVTASTAASRFRGWLPLIAVGPLNWPPMYTVGPASASVLTMSFASGSQARGVPSTASTAARLLRVSPPTDAKLPPA